MSNKQQACGEVDRNEDLITGEPGSHPIGTGLGTAAGGAAAGAAAGAVGGPLGAAAGAVIGGVAGGLAGKAIAEQIDPTVEHAYWRDECQNRPYHDADADFDRDYSPAYRHGWESRARYDGQTFEQSESAIRRDWEQDAADSQLDWDRAKPAIRDAWDRVERALPGDADNDGK